MPFVGTSGRFDFLFSGETRSEWVCHTAMYFDSRSGVLGVVLDAIILMAGVDVVSSAWPQEA